MYKEKLVKFIKYVNEQIPLLEQTNEQYSKKIIEITSFLELSSSLDGEGKIINKVLDDYRILEKLEKERAFFYERIEANDKRIIELKNQLKFVKSNICPHEKTEYDETNYHTGERYYRCVLCGAKL